MNIKIDLTIEDVNFILQVFGQLPTSSNAYPLLKKIEGQAIEQMPKDQPKPE